MELQPGQLIIAPFLSAPAEVKKFEPRSFYCLLEVVLEDGQHTFKPVRIITELQTYPNTNPTNKTSS
jgi:hypothetical protein